MSLFNLIGHLVCFSSKSKSKSVADLTAPDDDDDEAQYDRFKNSQFQFPNNYSNDERSTMTLPYKRSGSSGQLLSGIGRTLPSSLTAAQVKAQLFALNQSQTLIYSHLLSRNSSPLLTLSILQLFISPVGKLLLPFCKVIIGIPIIWCLSTNNLFWVSNCCYHPYGSMASFTFCMSEISEDCCYGDLYSRCSYENLYNLHVLHHVYTALKMSFMSLPSIDRTTSSCTQLDC